jgi:hypothetical protein
VFDGSVGAGGIDEKHGCFVSFYDEDTGMIQDSLYEGRVPLPMVQKPCSDESVKELLSKYVAKECFAMVSMGQSLKKTIFGGPGANALRAAACIQSRDRRSKKAFCTPEPRPTEQQRLIQ